MAITGSETDIAQQTLSILLDMESGRTTFQPLKTKDEFLDKKKK